MKRMATYLLVLAFILTALSVSGPPLRASGTDERIVSSFRNTYVSRVDLKDGAVRVEAKDGVVTLTGTVADEAHKLLAEETAASLPGVERVDNKLATRAEAAARGTKN